jgi:hypothetical protein
MLNGRRVRDNIAVIMLGKLLVRLEVMEEAPENEACDGMCLHKDFPYPYVRGLLSRWRDDVR